MSKLTIRFTRYNTEIVNRMFVLDETCKLDSAEVVEGKLVCERYIEVTGRGSKAEVEGIRKQAEEELRGELNAEYTMVDCETRILPHLRVFVVQFPGVGFASVPANVFEDYAEARVKFYDSPYDVRKHVDGGCYINLRELENLRMVWSPLAIEKRDGVKK